MFIERIIKKAHKAEAIFLRDFYKFFIKSFEEKIINKIRLKIVLRLIKIETTPEPYFNELDGHHPEFQINFKNSSEPVYFVHANFMIGIDVKVNALKRKNLWFI